MKNFKEVSAMEDILEKLDRIQSSLETLADVLFYAGDKENGEWASMIAYEVEEVIKQIKQG